MRVVHVVDRLAEVGGVQTYLRSLLPALASVGIDGTVLSADEALPSFAGAEVVPVPGLDADSATLGRETRLRLVAALRAAAADAVFVHIGPSPEIVALARTSAFPVVYAHDYVMVCPGNARYLHSRASFCSEGPGARCLVRAYTERCTNRRPDRLLRARRRADAWARALPGLERVLVASPFMSEALARGGARSQSVKVVPYPIEAAARCDPSPGERSDVLFVGRLVRAKGAHVLLRALAELPGATAAIAGDGPERAALQALAAELGLARRVRFLGWVAAGDRRRLLGSARVMAMPSLWQEPFGISGLESLAAGLPVVASAVGGIPSWLEEEEGGLLVPADDPRRLAEALARVLADDGFRAALSERGPLVAARFSMERHLELLLPELAPSAA